MLKSYVVTVMVLVAFAVGCSSSPRRITDRKDGFSSRPEWVESTEALKESGGKIWMVESSSMGPTDNRIACAKASTLRARTSLAEQLQTKINSLAQAYLSNGSDEFNQSVKAIVSQNLPGTKEEATYWEIEEQRIGDHMDSKMYCYSKVSMPGETYRLILKNIVDSTTNTEIKKVMDNESKRFLSSEDKKTSE